MVGRGGGRLCGLGVGAGKGVMRGRLCPYHDADVCNAAQRNGQQGLLAQPQKAVRRDNCHAILVLGLVVPERTQPAMRARTVRHATKRSRTDRRMQWHDIQPRHLQPHGTYNHGALQPRHIATTAHTTRPVGTVSSLCLPVTSYLTSMSLQVSLPVSLCHSALPLYYSALPWCYGALLTQLPITIALSLVQSLPISLLL